MLTKKLWQVFKDYTIGDYEVVSGGFHTITPGDKALCLMLCVGVTPFLFVFDIALLPLEIVYCIIKKHYEKGDKHVN